MKTNYRDIEGMMDFIFEKMPSGVIVIEKESNIIFSNTRGKFFLERYKLPDEFTSINKNIFEAIVTGRLEELFPGDIYLEKRLEGSTSMWEFRFEICVKQGPFVIVFITEKPITDKLNVNGIRRQYRLTRRETDMLRGILRGLKNSDIADECNISEQTVKEYLGNVYSKLGVKGKFELFSAFLNYAEQNVMDKEPESPSTEADS